MKNDLKEAIDCAIRNNAMEGLITSAETTAMLKRVAAGKLAFDDMRKTVEYKARELAKRHRNNSG